MAKLTPKQKKFVEEYVIDWNATRAYKIAYPDASDKAAESSSSRLIRNGKIQAYAENIQKDLSKLSGLTAMRNLLELKKIAFSNMSDFKKDWFDIEDYEKLDPETKAAISEITTEVTRVKLGEKKIIKFKLHDKLKAIEMINKMLGFNDPDKVDVTTGGDKLSTDPVNIVFKNVSKTKSKKGGK